MISDKVNDTVLLDKSLTDGKEKVYIQNVENCTIYLPIIIKAFYA